MPFDMSFESFFPNFKPEEFACPCGRVECVKHGIEYWFVAAIQDLRLQVGFPLVINSGFRCKTYNRTIPGTVGDHSFHCKGIAADIAIGHLSSGQKHKLFRKVFLRFNGVGIYPTFLHLDLRPGSNKAVWIREA